MGWVWVGGVVGVESSDARVEKLIWFDGDVKMMDGLEQLHLGTAARATIPLRLPHRRSLAVEDFDQSR
jgi:hypothetical protein